MVDRRRNILFIHIPKNAGTSIERNVFDGFNFSGNYSREYLFGYDLDLNINLQHATVDQLLEHKLIDKEELESLTSFCIVRNPYARAISGYIWLMKDLKIDGSFEQFLKREGSFSKDTLGGNSSNVEDHFYTQSKFVTHQGKIRIDHVLHFEKISQEFRRFSNMNDLNVTLSTHFKKNRNSRWDLAKLMTKENISLIHEIYDDDFINFNYSRNFNKWKYILGYV